MKTSDRKQILTLLIVLLLSMSYLWWRVDGYYDKRLQGTKMQRQRIISPKTFRD